MIYGVYSLRDKFTGFMNPAIDQSDDAAKRNFAFAMNNNPGVLGFAPADFDLYKIAAFDSVSGRIDPLPAVQFICNGLEVFNEK